MRSKLLFAFLAVTSCKQACGLDEATTGGGPSGGAPPGGGPAGGAPAGGGGTGGASPSLNFCSDFDPDDFDPGEPPACGGDLVTANCALGSNQLRYDCGEANGCVLPMPSMQGEATTMVPMVGTIRSNNGVLELQPNDSGFFTTQPALYVHRENVPGNFLAVAMVQPLDGTTSDESWPDGPANLGGLVVRRGTCESANCGQWTKLEVGIGPLRNSNPAWVFASSRDGMPATAPTQEDAFEWGELVGANAAMCPPVYLVGLCVTRTDGAVTTRGQVARLNVGAPFGPTVTHTWEDIGSSEALDVGIVAASGYPEGSLGVDDIRARFGLFAIFTSLADEPSVAATQCGTLFEAARAQLQADQPLELLD